MIWGGPGQNLINFQLKSNQKFMENGVGWPGQNLINFQLKSNYKLKENGASQARI